MGRLSGSMMLTLWVIGFSQSIVESHPTRDGRCVEKYPFCRRPERRAHLEGAVSETERGLRLPSGVELGVFELKTADAVHRGGDIHPGRHARYLGISALSRVYELRVRTVYGGYRDGGLSLHSDMHSGLYSPGPGRY